MLSADINSFATKMSFVCQQTTGLIPVSYSATTFMYPTTFTIKPDDRMTLHQMISAQVFVQDLGIAEYGYVYNVNAQFSNFVVSAGVDTMWVKFYNMWRNRAPIGFNDPHGTIYYNYLIKMNSMKYIDYWNIVETEFDLYYNARSTT